MPPKRIGEKEAHLEKNRKMNRNKRKMFQYSAEQLERALEEIKEKRLKIREASRQFNIPKTTLIDRLKGRVLVARRKTGPDPILTIEIEKKIVEWIVKIAKCGFPLKKTDLLDTVQKIAKETNKAKFFKDGRPGQKWYKQFLRRHPQLSLREAEGINKARAIVTEEYVRAWFNELQIFLRENNLLEIVDNPSRVFNGDESGFALCPKSGKVLAPKGWRNLYQIKLGNEKENLTVLIVFSANGVICPPLIVFPYIRPPRAVIDSMPDDWVLGRSESGWMNSDVFFEYIANDFNKWLNEKQIQRPIILFIDGHKSHMTLALSEFCDRNGIVLYALPPNTTHMLQPADVSVFKPMKTEWKKTVRNWQSRPENTNMCVTKLNFCQLFKETVSNKNMKDNIINGFRKCGLCPLNPDNVDFTKCVKNFQETVTNENNTEGCISPDECMAAKKVITRIAPRLREYGINVEVILLEIKSVEGSDISSTTPIEPPLFEEQGVLQVGEIVSLQDVTIVPIDNVALKLNTMPPPSPAVECSVQDSDIDPPKDPECLCEMASEENENSTPPQFEDAPFNLIFNNNTDDSDLCLKEVESKTLLPTVKKNPLQSILDNHLFIPKPLEFTAKNKKIKDNFPSAISSEAWRMKLAKKEEEKCQKGQEAKKKREEKQAQAKNRAKRTINKKNEKKPDKTLKLTGKENENEKNRKGSLQCSACDEDLISDVEDEDEKNIGCDKCPRWYHMKCTEFLGMSYNEVASKEYICFMCS